MTSDYGAALAETARSIFEAASQVAASLPQANAQAEEVRPSVQTEIAWCLIEKVLADVSDSQASSEGRDQIQEGLALALIARMLDELLTWPDNTGDSRWVQTETLLYWYQEAALDYESTSGSMPPTVSEPVSGDGLVSKLCTRVAGLTGKDAASALVEPLGRALPRAYAAFDLAQRATTVIDAWRRV